MTVRRSVRDGVHTLALARPPVNALALELVEALGAAVAESARDPDCAAVVLTGQPGVFSAGIDTVEVPGYSPEQRAAMLRAVNRTVLELYSLEKPIVAAVSGHALGGGLVLALTCDVRLAARGAFRLGLTEAAAGIPFPAGPLAVLEAEVPADERRVLTLTARVWSPDDPGDCPLIDRVVEPDALLDAAHEQALSLAGLRAHAAVKRQLRARTTRRLRRVVERDEEPLLEHWL